MGPEAEQEALPDKVPEHVKVPHSNVRLPSGNQLPSGTTEKSEVTEPAEKLPESEPKDLLAQELEDVELPHRHIRLPSGIRIVKYLGPKDIVVELIAPIPIEESNGGIRKNTTEKVQLIDLIIGDEEETSETITQRVEMKEQNTSNHPNTEVPRSTTTEKAEHTEPAKNLLESEPEDLPEKVLQRVKPRYRKLPYSEGRVFGERVLIDETIEEGTKGTEGNLREREPKELQEKEAVFSKPPHRHVVLPSGLRIVQHLGTKDIPPMLPTPPPLNENKQTPQPLLKKNEQIDYETSGKVLVLSPVVATKMNNIDVP